MKTKQEIGRLGFGKTLLLKFQQRLFYDYLTVIFTAMIVCQFLDQRFNLQSAIQFIVPFVLSLFILIAPTIRAKVGKDFLPWTRFDNYGSDGSILFFGFLLSTICNIAVFGFPTY